ncbi:MAG: class I SAM-dependent methyltransferase [Anaerolineales bacterium]|nr:class I SAM-dependent methyltransferase [Anaerolineales bacterium]
MPSSSYEKVENFYSEQVPRRIKMFINGDKRVERAWDTVERYAPLNPQNILEVGCGIGYISYRMSCTWPQAHVTGLDITPVYIETANKLFGSPKLDFVTGLLQNKSFELKFDLIVFMDVYEHIEAVQRLDVNRKLAELLEDGGKIILTVPTPRHLDWLKENMPHIIQPVDENISLSVVEKLVEDTKTQLELYKEVDVWRIGDYAHIVLKKSKTMIDVEKVPKESSDLFLGIKNLLERRKRDQKRKYVRDRLGYNIFSK